jgi:hypothetical protein
MQRMENEYLQRMKNFKHRGWKMSIHKVTSTDLEAAELSVDGSLGGVDLSIGEGPLEHGVRVGDLRRFRRRAGRALAGDCRQYQRYRRQRNKDVMRVAIQSFFCD